MSSTMPNITAKQPKSTFAAMQNQIENSPFAVQSCHHAVCTKSYGNPNASDISCGNMRPVPHQLHPCPNRQPGTSISCNHQHASIAHCIAGQGNQKRFTYFYCFQNYYRSADKNRNHHTLSLTITNPASSGTYSPEGQKPDTAVELRSALSGGLGGLFWRKNRGTGISAATAALG